ncbi:MAG TPA: hypothetical protein VNU49_00275 [Opitutaceae bacterium]|nr:hypothetical protein [Opitutaceae bacterium]
MQVLNKYYDNFFERPGPVKNELRRKLREVGQHSTAWDLAPNAMEVFDRGGPGAGISAVKTKKGVRSGINFSPRLWGAEIRHWPGCF